MKKIMCTAVMLMLLMALMPASEAAASSVSISISTDNEAPLVGDMVKIYVSLKGDVVLGEFDAYLRYDEELLEYAEGPSCASDNSGIISIFDAAPASDTDTRKYIFTFRALKKGYCEIALSGQPEVYEQESGYLMSVSSSTCSVQVGADESASGNAYLESLKISPGVLSPEFHRQTTEYETVVEYTDERLIISAIPEDMAAKVEMSGNQELSVGQNRIVILVTAEDGTEQKYVIYAIRKEGAAAVTEFPETELPEDEPEAVDELESIKQDCFKISIQKDDIVTLVQGAFEYIAKKPDAGIEAPAGYIRTSIILSGVSLTAYAPKDKPDSDFLLLYLSREGGTPMFYSYDRTEQTIQRYGAGQQLLPLSMEAEPSETGMTEAEYEENMSTMTVMIAILCGVCSLLIFGLIRSFLKRTGKDMD